MIEYIKGDVLHNSNTKRIIAHVCNNVGGFGKGFALAVAKKYPMVKKRYNEWYNSQFIYKDVFQLGDWQDVFIDDNLTFVNMLCQNGYKSEINPCPLDYDALERCLYGLDCMNRVEIWMPRIGSGLAGGDWRKIENRINCFLKDRIVKVFEL